MGRGEPDGRGDAALQVRRAAGERDRAALAGPVGARGHLPRPEPRGRAAQVLPGRLLPLSQRHRAARRSPAGLHRHRRVRAVPAHDRASRAAPLRLRHLRAARRAVRHRHRPAPGRDRAAERGRHAPPAAAPRSGTRPSPRDHDQRPVLLPLDAVDLPADLQQLVRPGRRAWTGLSAAEQRDIVDDHRLAYQAEQIVNWCPGLGTVLADEEVTDEGRSAVGNYPVYRRPLRQWLLRITAFAERLLADLDGVDWPENVKRLQRNWIGPSGGPYRLRDWLFSR